MDSETTLYNGEIKVFFKHKSHRYWVSDSLIEDGKRFSVPGVTGTSDNQFHLKGHLLTWAGRFNATWLADQLKEGKELTEELIKEATKAHERHRDKAANLGSVVHNLAEEWFTTGRRPGVPVDRPDEQGEGKRVPIGADEQEQIDNALHHIGLIIDNNDIEVLGLEDVCYYRPNEDDPTPPYVGTRDLHIKWNGVLTSGDWKTNNSDHYFQKSELKKGDRIREIQPTGLSPSVFYQLGAYDAAKGQETGVYCEQHIGINLAKHKRYKTYKEFKRHHIRINTEVEKNRETFKKLAQARADSRRVQEIVKERILKETWHKN